jgi:glycosyltransferase involved in cell wall biosynthesis
MSLAVVIPLFNEEKTIGLLIKDLHTLLASQHIEHQFIIINDGSTDSSLTILELLSASIPGMQIITHKNCGHGPSLLSGYNLALKQEWVFQLDSDYQYDLAAFNLLWKNKQDYDLLIAERKKRNASIPRDIATAVSQGLVRFLYGRGLKDINSPYRLMRAEKLALVLPHIKVNSFAPNILISAYFLKKKFRIFTTGADQLVNVSERKSKMSLYIFKGCLKSFSDTFLFRFKI